MTVSWAKVNLQRERSRFYTEFAKKEDGVSIAKLKKQLSFIERKCVFALFKKHKTPRCSVGFACCPSWIRTNIVRTKI
jgi:hypothetical protein